MRGPGLRPRVDKGIQEVRIPCGIQPEDTADEKWRPVPGWETFYCVSDLGRVWSMHQFGRFITGMEVRGGYRVIKLRDNHRIAHKAIHVLVLMAFRGPRPENYQGCHNDGQPRNNRLVNLRWDTVAANQADRKIHGSRKGGRPIRAKCISDNLSLDDAYLLAGHIDIKMTRKTYDRNRRRVQPLR